MPTNDHFYEAQVIRNVDFLRTVEAAMMKVAFEVFQESPETPGHQNRAHIALNVFTDEYEAAKFARFFANVVLHNPTLRGQVYQPTLPNPVTPQNMDGTALRTAILNAWNVAAGVTD